MTGDVIVLLLLENPSKSSFTRPFPITLEVSDPPLCRQNQGTRRPAMDVGQGNPTGGRERRFRDLRRLHDGEEAYGGEGHKFNHQVGQENVLIEGKATAVE